VPKRKISVPEVVYIQSAPGINIESVKVSTVAQSNENSLYIYMGPEMFLQRARAIRMCSGNGRITTAYKSSVV
jgi:hypothetical protein